MQPSYQTTQPQPRWGSQSPHQLPQQQPQVPPQQTAQQPAQQQPTQPPELPQQGVQQPAPMPAQGQTPAQAQPPFPQQPGFAPQSTLQPPGAGQFEGQSSPGQAQGMPMQQPASAQQPGPGQAPPSPVQAQSAAQTAPPATSPPMQPSGQQPPQQPPQSSPAQVQQPELGPGTVPQPLAADQERLATSPLVDVLDAPEAITVYVDLPGCDEEDIQLKAAGNTLHISATRPEEKGGDEDRPLQRERRGRIERTITLPVPINVEEAKASCEDGVCTITLPKSEESRQKSIAFQ